MQHLNTYCVLSDELTNIQDDETVTEVTEITQTDIAKEQKVDMEAKESTEPAIVLG